MRNTFSPELDELVIWYYAGHGLGKETAKNLAYSSTPCLYDKLRLDPTYNDSANEFVKEGRKVKGGELCLHKVGFCDLYGLLKPWIAAVRTESINAKGTKKNKHLVIILDSCYSGIIAQELDEFKEQAQEILASGNTVTIQTACGPDEPTYGGYFTPCFTYLNDPKNEKLLTDLKIKWEKMTEEVRNEYRSIGLPSPMVVTTSTASQGPTMERKVQNLKFTLFTDPGFFKFCSIQVYKDVDSSELREKERVLNPFSARSFMCSPNFTVLDYKLKTFQGTPADRRAQTPMGLFLLEDPTSPGFAVCAHIHFQKGNTNKAERINLVHHTRPPMGSVLYVEDHQGLSQSEIQKNKHKIEVTSDTNAPRLLQVCKEYVEKQQPGVWEDVSQWKKKGSQLGVNGLFRAQEERSAWEASYLEYIKEFNLPTVSDTQ